MFDGFSVVSTAISSFNNAALMGPCFFAVGLLSLPLFYFVFLYGRDILSRLKWTGKTETKISFWAVFCLVLWLLLFGGNYAVIRDSVSVLPVMVAFVLFVSMIYITNQAIKLNYLTVFQDRKVKWVSGAMLLVLAFFSAKPDLWGVLMQLSAVVCGIIVGSRLHKNISDISMSTLIFGIMTTLILMQPEYFRFGQLGNLTLVHLGALLMTGFFAVSVLVLKYTNARAKIHESAYIKLKWLFRIIALLALILFVLTESVPVFIGLLGAIGVSEMLTIYHSRKTSENLAKQSWVLLLMCFGVLIMCPVITCLGIIYLCQNTEKPKAKDFQALL